MLEELEVFYGSSSPASAQVYVRLPRQAEQVRLGGYVRGPECLYSKTLPATIPLVDLGSSSSSPLARAVIPDPCFWSPELPQLYDVYVELQQGDCVVQHAQRQLGIRRFGAADRNLWLEGKRWVLRGVYERAARQTDLDSWREHYATRVTEHPSDSLCEQASAKGVRIVARLEGDAEELMAQLRRLSQWAAVFVAVVQCPATLPEQLSAEVPNLLVAQQLADSAQHPAPWAQLVFCHVDEVRRFASQTASWQIPVVAVRPLAQPQPLAAARRACDQLQGDLAPYGDFAGYVV